MFYSMPILRTRRLPQMKTETLDVDLPVGYACSPRTLKKLVRTLRPLLTVQINVCGHILTAVPQTTSDAATS